MPSPARIVLSAIAFSALLPTGAGAAEPIRGCFAACMADHPVRNDDHFAFADSVRGCRDSCQAATLEAMKASGLYAKYAACKPEPLPLQAFRDLRAANPSWQAQFNVFLWDLRNTLPDVILTGITVKTQDMQLIDVELESEGLIPPGETGTFVIPDFFDGYPAVRYTTKVTKAMGCKIG